MRMKKGVCYLGELEALAPLLQRDEVVVVGVAAIQEGLDAVFQGEQRCPDGEQFVAGDFPVFLTNILCRQFPL